jgi:hypothetical protein
MVEGGLMTKYLLVFHGGGMPTSEEEAAAVTDAWMSWYGEMGAAVVDGGDPVGHAHTISSDGSVADGGGANPVTGYAVISADDMDGAVAMAKRSPHLTYGGSVEVCELFSVM